jgi:hypothetical protein
VTRRVGLHAQQPSVYAPSDTLGHAISGIGLFLAHSDFDHAGFIHNELADRFATHGPLLLELADTEMFFKSSVVHVDDSNYRRAQYHYECCLPFGIDSQVFALQT